MTATVVWALETASVGFPVTRSGVSLFPVYLHQEPPELEYLPGIDAIASQHLSIQEQGGGAVPHLRATSKLDVPVLFPEGDTLVGGLQNRTLNVTVLLSGHFDGPIPVSCVEAGRWGRHGEFRHGEIMTPRRVRLSKSRSVGESRLLDGSRSSDQAAVWRDIDTELGRRAVHSPTRSILDAHLMTSRLLADLADLGPLPGQNGVVASIGRTVIAADLFGRPETLRAYWRPIVASLAFDAGQEAEGRPSASAALRFLHRIAHAPATESSGVDLGTEIRFRSHRVEAQGLQLGSSLLHLSAFAA